MLAPNLPLLRTLSLCECPLMQDDVAVELVAFEETLTALNLSASMRLTDKGVRDISRLCNLTELKYEFVPVHVCIASECVLSPSID